MLPLYLNGMILLLDDLKVFFLAKYKRKKTASLKDAGGKVIETTLTDQMCGFFFSLELSGTSINILKTNNCAIYPGETNLFLIISV